MTVSAPQMHDHWSFSTSSSILLLTAEFPKFALTFVRKFLPVPEEKLAPNYLNTEIQSRPLEEFANAASLCSALM